MSMRAVKPGFVELDSAALYGAIRMVRDTLGMTWPEVWEQSGVAKASIDRLSRGRTIEATTMLRLMKWLGLTQVEPFMREVEE